MIEVSGLRLPLTRLNGTDAQELAAVKDACARKLHVRPTDITGVQLRKRSIDARKRSDIMLTYTAAVTLGSRESTVAKRAKGARYVESYPESCLPHPQPDLLDERPIVVGAGCAGLFCALALASAGVRPLLIERGDAAQARRERVLAFERTGKLDPESNIQFGLGGAGTFSDGKLTTGTKSPYHQLILRTLADAGAARRILWDAKPHVGSDVLPDVVSAVCKQIEDLGGEVRFRTRMVDLDVRDRQVRGIIVEHAGETQRIESDNVIVACGHSARDVFELLRDRDCALERKTFAMGVRIEHLQADIDKALFGGFAGHPALGAASYKLACHLKDGRSAFSFCMCPGGTVVCAASEPQGVVTNGQSLSARDGECANAALLANVFPDDLEGDDVLAGVELQRLCEQAAFQAGGGEFVAPSQLVGDFLHKAPSSAQGRVTPTYARGVRWTDLSPLLPAYITDTLRSSLPLLDRKLRGFASPDAVLTGVETRSSSPVRIVRTDEGVSRNICGLWPCGEGAGYAGGIMSAATDGLRCAEAVLAHAGKAGAAR